MYNKLFSIFAVLSRNGILFNYYLVYFYVIIYSKGKEHRFTKEKSSALRTIHSLYARPTQKNIQKCADLLKNFVFLCHDFQQKLLTHLLLLTI